jgi:hypothetical protein
MVDQRDNNTSIFRAVFLVEFLSRMVFGLVGRQGFVM